MAEKRGAGNLSKWVAFDQRISADDGHGNKQDGFAEVFQCHAGFEPMRGGEAIIASRLEGVQPIAVHLRASPNTLKIRPDWRMRDLRDGTWSNPPDNSEWDGPLYAVKSALRTPDRKYIDLIVTSGVAA